ncbi:Sec-independent protein translocase subunit TatA [Branchiibius sp. NY16-3462-2]|uniref:Sec-independent protein translocase subunit TatA n=1 Tax=Branchiibius sp. NY16-3462-2 TaxID=1807500 RepID=UPI000B09835F|nr:Sec-independent protein translocase subunit TatA [Branchiibius sp. NY16-3462-2]
MGLKGLFDGWHIVIIILLLVVVFGWKRLPDAARSLGRSARILKSEIGDMKDEGKSPGAGTTVPGETVPPQQTGSTVPGEAPVQQPPVQSYPQQPVQQQPSASNPDRGTGA